MLKLLERTAKSLYRQYEMVTCLYMFEPWEKNLINGFVLVVASLMIYSSVVYLPAYIETFVKYLSPLPMDAQDKDGATRYTPMLHTQKILS